MLTSGHPGLEIRLLAYCTLYNTVQWSAQKHDHSYRIHVCDSVHQTRELTCVVDIGMHICNFESLQLEGFYVGDLL